MITSAAACVSVNLTDQPGSVQRLLGTVRRRGFRIDNLILTRNPVTDGYRIEMRLAGERSFETLAKHIANLFEVSSVSLQTSSPAVEFAGSGV